LLKRNLEKLASNELFVAVLLLYLACHPPCEVVTNRTSSDAT
jgi:hypothetical protein